MQTIIVEAESVTPERSTRELIERSQRGDTAAFEVLYRSHVGQVYGLCMRLCGDSATATERTQDTFVRAWTALETFRGEASFGTWLHRLALNVVRDGWRGDARRRTRFENRDELPDGPPADPIQVDDRIDLERAIASLPPRARRVIVLHEIYGYRCREVAELTGTAVGTVQAHLHRARRLLREVLG